MNFHCFLISLLHIHLIYMNSSIDIIKQTVQYFFPLSTILLFGSRAKKTFSEDSDFDFIVITEQELNIKEKRHYQSIIRKKPAENKIPADILIQNRSDFEKKKNIKGHIVRQAVKEGIEL